MKRTTIKAIGAFFILVGLLLILNSSLPLTGFIISERIGKTTFNLIGLVFIIFGIILFNYRLSLEVRVYDTANGKSKRSEHGRNFKMTDPEFYFGEKGLEGISLSEFRIEIKRLKESSDSSGLIQIVRESYGPQLEQAIEMPKGLDRVIDYLTGQEQEE
jgi:hypothetical protein